MEKKKKKLIIGFIILNLILVPWIIIHNNFDLEKVLKYSKELALFEFAVTSIIIAISLFDQFGLNKKLTEKRVELIIDLLTELKNQSGFGCHYQLKGKLFMSTSFYFEKDMAKKAIESYSDRDSSGILNTRFMMDSNDFYNGFEKVREVVNNPIMPKSIVDKIQFLGVSGGYSNSEIKEADEIAHIYFTSEYKKKLVKKETKYWCISSRNDCTLLEFLQKFDDLFDACENWTDKHSNINEGLNLDYF